MCNCIKGRYDFKAEAFNENTILYTDLSEWVEEPNYSIPKTYTLEVIFPLKSDGHSFEVQTNVVNKINKECVMDGLYCFKVTSCGKEYTKYKALFPKLQCKLDNAILQESKYAIEAAYQLNLVSVHAEIGDYEGAKSALRIAESLLSHIDCKC